MTQDKILTFIRERTADGHAVDVGQLGDQFGLSLDAAVGHLWRLWRERLIETISPRPARFRFRLEPGESMAPLRFRITRRGRERLRWYAKADSGGWSLFR